MLRTEWKKMLQYRKGAWLVALFLLAELIGLLFFTQPYDRELEENRAVYNKYLVRVEGSLTRQKQDYIESEMERLSQVHRTMGSVEAGYYAGTVTEAEYRAQFEALAAEASDYTGFSKLYSQYIYVRESAERSFLYTGGWEVLLGRQEPDYLYLLLLVFLLTPIFCQEYKTQMDRILLTQKKSACGAWRSKVLAALILTVGLTTVLQLMELIYCAVRFGLPHWDYSLQSLVSFGITQKELTLWQAFLLQFVIRELGYIYTALLILFFSVCLKRYNLALMAGIAALPLPFLTVNTGDVFVRIPGPWAMTIGRNYLNGSITYKHAITGEQITAFAEVSWVELGMLFMCVVLILVGVLYMIWRKNTNCLLRSARKKHAVLMLCVVGTLLAGCGKENDSTVYNLDHGNFYTAKDYVIIADIFSNVIIDETTGQVYSFPLDAFTEDTASASPFFYGKGDKLYYIKKVSSSERSGMPGPENYVLAVLNMQAMEETVYYQWNQSSEWFFGLLDRESTEANPWMMNGFFLHGSYIYYEHGGEAAVYRMNRYTGENEAYLELSKACNIAYDGENIYYTDHYNRLVLRNLDSGDEHAVEEVAAYDFILTPEGIYFLNMRDAQTLYYWDAAAGEAIKLNDTPGYQLYWDNTYLWLLNPDGYVLHRMDHDGSNEKVLDQDFLAMGTICMPEDNQYLYVLNSMKHFVYKVDKETFVTECLIGP